MKVTVINPMFLWFAGCNNYYAAGEHEMSEYNVATIRGMERRDGVRRIITDRYCPEHDEAVHRAAEYQKQKAEDERYYGVITGGNYA